MNVAELAQEVSKAVYWYLKALSEEGYCLDVDETKRKFVELVREIIGEIKEGRELLPRKEWGKPLTQNEERLMNLKGVNMAEELKWFKTKLMPHDDTYSLVFVWKLKGGKRAKQKTVAVFRKCGGEGK